MRTGIRQARLVVGAALAIPVALVPLLWASSGDAGEPAPRCFGKTATIVDTDIEFIVGSDEADVIVAGDKDNQVEGRGGADLICTGDGEDVVSGGPGADQINGGVEGDLLIGGGGGDKLYGKADADVLDGKGGKDLCVGGPGNDLAAARRCDRIRGADPSER